MNYKKSILFLLFVVLTFTWLPTGQAMSYLLKPGDMLQITVYEHPEISLEQVLVQPGGVIAVPLAGELQVAGMTTAELTAVITESLKVYLEAPAVAVNIVRMQQMRVSILGEVNRPGLYGFEQGRTVLEAISMASGWTKGAAKKKVYLYHREKGDTKATMINLMDILKNGMLSQNYALADGDIIYLSENHKVNLVRDILPFVNPLHVVRHWREAP